MCEKQVADLQGFLLQTLGQKGNNWVHVCNILQTLLVKNAELSESKEEFLKSAI